ncbi:hypothetical protein CEXT_114531 [Caerostris extrusa]|uniref:Uncharacterized protein n=1 Tax=Caerostris extrusa TaxID=172846 RepID=A0AAV4X6N8_CAEEX|nr:hypothetical protein CEXT_114531 [Caerostris extrusa]
MGPHKLSRSRKNKVLARKRRGIIRLLVPKTQAGDTKGQICEGQRLACWPRYRSSQWPTSKTSPSSWGWHFAINQTSTNGVFVAGPVIHFSFHCLYIYSKAGAHIQCCMLSSSNQALVLTLFLLVCRSVTNVVALLFWFVSLSRRGKQRRSLKEKSHAGSQQRGLSEM